MLFAHENAAGTTILTTKCDPPAAQDELNDWCLEGLNEGKVVVRLKIGDPFVFGRGGEEILWFRSHGYEPIVIPGISSALAAPLEGMRIRSPAVERR
jgi:uroporphyrin-III C-methyltransferase